MTAWAVHHGIEHGTVHPSTTRSRSKALREHIVVLAFGILVLLVRWAASRERETLQRRSSPARKRVVGIY
jgi:hypothetical protein